MRLRGVFTVIRRCAYTGRELGRKSYSNNLTSASLTAIRNRIFSGTGSNWNPSNVSVRIYNSDGTTHFTSTGSAAFDAAEATTTAREYEWSDERDSTTYSKAANRADIRVGSSNTVVSTISKSLGTKPSNEHWTYLWTLSFSASGSPRIPSGALAAMMQQLVGADSGGLTLRGRVILGDGTDRAIDGSLTKANLAGGAIKISLSDDNDALSGSPSPLELDNKRINGWQVEYFKTSWHLFCSTSFIGAGTYDPPPGAGAMSWAGTFTPTASYAS